MQKIGLVLEGGGVKGAYQAGALRALIENGAHFDAVAGASIGAINGALFAGYGLEGMLKFWREADADLLYDLDLDEIRYGKDGEFRLGSTILSIGKRESVPDFLKNSATKARKAFANILSEADLRKSDMDFGLVVYNFSDRKAEELMMGQIAEGKLVDYIMASAAYPLFPPMMIDGKKYIDGGVYDNMPVNLLARCGYDKMLVIRTNVMEKKPKRKLERTDLQLRYLAPKQTLGSGLRFSARNIAAFLEKGYDDAVAAIKNGLDGFWTEG